jgi:hypothetical protein
MYGWLVFVHVISVFGFLLAHGASAAAAFALRCERRLEQVQALLSLSGNSFGALYLTLLALLASGIGLGFLGGWWGQGWIWTSLGLLVAVVIAMSVLAALAYGEARKSAGLPYYERGRSYPALPAASPAELDAALARGNPWLLLAIGAGGLGRITGLMLFKPFQRSQPPMVSPTVGGFPWPPVNPHPPPAAVPRRSAARAPGGRRSRPSPRPRRWRS